MYKINIFFVSITENEQHFFNTDKSFHTFLDIHHPLVTITTFIKKYNTGSVCHLGFEKQMSDPANERRSVKTEWRDSAPIKEPESAQHKM